MLQHRSVSHTPDSTVQAQTVPQHACCLYNTVTQLRSTIIALSSELSNSDSTSSSDTLASLVDELAAKVRRTFLIAVFDMRYRAIVNGEIQHT